MPFAGQWSLFNGWRQTLEFYGGKRMWGTQLQKIKPKTIFYGKSSGKSIKDCLGMGLAWWGEYFPSEQKEPELIEPQEFSLKTFQEDKERIGTREREGFTGQRMGKERARIHHTVRAHSGPQKSSLFSSSPLP
ncbi:hypothetical protein CEXT_651721 [Caerostris extrusa]|uniref:Uncharacterized protein n=1 Tax=Caerostris extrusa TaxID=172846 RepID=A0AAV4X7W9_CAEEX|nr:hypothetical protein CEXT_651721 [Caerostris extrusa]